MSVFRVWAPQRRRVEIDIGGSYYPMERGEDGWWIGEVVSARAGVDYQFRLDGDASFPDPRSCFQPHGVHGASRVVDFSSFSWTHPEFRPPPLSSGLIYELHIGTFTPAGTFEAAIDKLEYLVQLGVTHVELMPVAEFLGTRGWGYDGVQLYAPHHGYGGPEGLARLVDACHGHGLAVLLDVVYNHLGPAGNYLPQFGPYFTERHKTPWGAAVNFDGPYSDEVREYCIDNARMWLRDYRFDGLRIDAVHAIVDTSAIPFLEQLVHEVRHLEAQLGRQLSLIAESDLNDPRVILPHERDGFGYDAQWNDDFHHAVHTTLTNESLGYYRDFGGVQDLASVFQRPFLYAGQYSCHRRRAHGRPADGIQGSSFIVYSQTHDQVGNRAVGERLCHLVTLEQAKIAAALAILSPYVPMLFQGEEWAASSPFQYFVDFSEDPDLAEAVAAGRKREFSGFHHDDDVPNPQSLETFERSKLNWEEFDQQDHQEMFEWYRELIALRRRLPALVDGRLEHIKSRYDQESQWLVVERWGTALIANLNSERQRIVLPGEAERWIELSSNTDAVLDSHAISMPAHSVALVRELGVT